MNSNYLREENEVIFKFSLVARNGSCATCERNSHRYRENKRTAIERDLSACKPHIITHPRRSIMLLKNRLQDFNLSFFLSRARFFFIQSLAHSQHSALLCSMASMRAAYLRLQSRQIKD